MDNNSRATSLRAVTGLTFSVLAFCAGMIALLATDPTIIFESIDEFLDLHIGKRVFRFVDDLPFFRFYETMWPMYLVFVVFIVVIPSYEYKQRTIPDVVTIPAMVIGLGFAVGFRHLSLTNCVLGIVGVFCVFRALNSHSLRTRGKIGIDTGDVKMIAMIVAFLGVADGIATLAIASSFAATYAATIRRRPSSENLAFSPWLAAAALLLMLIPTSYVLDQSLSPVSRIKKDPVLKRIQVTQMSRDGNELPISKLNSERGNAYAM